MNSKTAKKTCRVPDCNQIATSIGRRGKNSTAADNSKRSAWCAFHRKGNGRAEREAFQRGKAVTL